jgi:hypothetical protein
MRYINNRRLKVPDEWQKKARDAEKEIADAALRERPDLFKKHGPLWGELKEELRKLSHDKCWYCESFDIRADNAVDHYRPKGNVSGAEPPHGGYWWLAFDHSNYRFSCTFCNSARKSEGETGGKQDFFPLVSEETRARSRDHCLDREDPLLLDPIKPLDVELLGFSDDGRAGLSVKAASGVRAQKVIESVKRYHLNQKAIVDRRLACIQKVRTWVDEADKKLKLYEQAADAASWVDANARLQDILDATDAEAEYSAAVRYYLAGRAPISAAAAAAVGALRAAG